MSDKPSLTRDDVEVIEKTTPFQGYFRIDRYRLRHRLHDGGWSDEMTREVFERGQAVAILLYDPALDSLVLIEQFRPGTFAALTGVPWIGGAESPWLIETVAGIIDEGETPETVARREAVEEADCAVRDLRYIGHFQVSPGASSETIFLYLGRVDASKAGGVHGLDHEHEDIRVRVVPAVEAFAWLDAGRIVNATTLVALQWFRHNHRKIRDDWS